MEVIETFNEIWIHVLFLGKILQGLVDREQSHRDIFWLKITQEQFLRFADAVYVWCCQAKAAYEPFAVALICVP